MSNRVNASHGGYAVKKEHSTTTNIRAVFNASVLLYHSNSERIGSIEWLSLTT